MSNGLVSKDYVVPPFEGLWWAEDMDAFTTKRDKSKWEWTMMILTPEWITEEMFAVAKEKVIAKKSVPEKLDDVHLQLLNEGTCVQTLHLDSYDDEGPVLEKCIMNLFQKTVWKWWESTMKFTLVILGELHLRS